MDTRLKDEEDLLIVKINYKYCMFELFTLAKPFFTLGMVCLEWVMSLYIYSSSQFPTAEGGDGTWTSYFLTLMG